MARKLTKEEALATLTGNNKKRLEKYFEIQKRFGRGEELTLSDDETAATFVKSLIEKDKKTADKAKAKKEENTKFDDAVKLAMKEGFSKAEIANMILDSIKAAKNKKIEEQIEALKAQILV